MTPDSAAYYLDPATGERFPLDPPRWCSPGRRPLMLGGLGGIGRDQIDPSLRSLWRYRAALPFPATPVSMGEGCTPLVPGRFRGHRCAFKLEWFSPTGSFKDRGASVMVSLLHSQGIGHILEDSSGNGGAAIAGYGAAAGVQVTLFVPASTSPAKVAQARAYGAQVELIPGPREATEAAAIDRSAEIFYASHNWHPFFLEGTKTLGYELWEDLGFRVPDCIVIPGAAGSNVLGCYLAFCELMRAGETDRLPRLFISQPQNCAPVHASFQAGTDQPVDIEFAPTVAEGTAIKKPIRLPQMIEALRSSGGGSVAVSEADIVAASLDLARNGLYVEPTCAHAAAGFASLRESGQIHADEETVVVLTGTGLKTTSFYAQRLDRDEVSGACVESSP